jgi:hypothetical protein
MNYRENDHYYTYILIITKQITYNNENSTKNVEYMHNKIMLTLKIILELITVEAYMKDCKLSHKIMTLRTT